MPKPAYAVTCYKVVFEVSHIPKELAELLFCISSLQGTLRKGCVGWSTSLSCDGRRLPPGTPGR